MLRQVPLFAPLTTDTLDELRQVAEAMRLPRGHALYQPDDPADDLFVVLSGRVKVTRRSRHSRDAAELVQRTGTTWTATAAASSVRESLLWVMAQGDMVGEQALVGTDGTHLDQATTITNATLLRFAADDVIAIMHHAPDLALALVRHLASRLSRADDQASGMVLGDVPGRTAWVLLQLADRFGEQIGQTVRVRHGLTQGEIAQIVGASRETVNKTLTDFAARGWIALEPKAVIVMDAERLRARTD